MSHTSIFKGDIISVLGGLQLLLLPQGTNQTEWESMYISVHEHIV